LTNRVTHLVCHRLGGLTNRAVETGVLPGPPGFDMIEAMPSIFFHTFGCKVNQYETESMRERLLKAGYRLTEDYRGSDVCLINSCSVTAEADRKCRQFVRKVLRENRKARVLVDSCTSSRA